MKKIVYLLGCLVLILFSCILSAAEGANISLEKVAINAHDRAAIVRGATFFAQNCMVCHSMKYLAHNKLAKEAGITLDKMPLKDREWYRGVVPPDLTLIARRRSPDWIYTYLLSFYKDPSQSLGSNNLLVPNTSMMNILAGMQGEQVLTEEGKQFLLHKLSLKRPHYYTILRLENPGGKSPEDFDASLTDLVNFFVYAGDPGRDFRIKLGIAVMVFLILFLILAYLLKKIYWKKVS